MGLATESIRNIVIVGHGSTGKTSFVENCLAAGGAITKPETVGSGKTVSDYTDDEIERNISIYTSITHLDWNGTKINCFDTPGSSDFVGEVIAAFRASECAVLMVGGDTGVQIETIKLWRIMHEISMPRITFINKMEKEHADFENTLTDLKEKFQVAFVPVTIPVGTGTGYRGVVNLIDKKAYLNDGGASDIPDDISDQVEDYRTQLVEAAAEGNDTLMEKYLEEETLTDDEILRGLREGFSAGSIFPVFCGSAEAGSGITSFLNFIASVAPSPAKTQEPVQGEEADSVPIDSSGTPSCFIFKTNIDQFSGKLSYVKMITGTLKPESEMFNVRDKHKERLSKLYTCQGKKLEEAGELVAGDIGVLVKLSTADTGDTLSSAGSSVIYDPIHLPQPVHAVAISAVSKNDDDKLNQLLQRQAEEDPSFKLKYESETRETVISAMGELHLSIILDKIKDKQGIEIQTRVPKVAYRETLTKSASAEYQHKKQTGGHGQYARVSLEIMPVSRGEDFKFVNAIRGGAVSAGYIPGVEKGIREGMENGVLAGFPVVDLEARIVDGKEHPVDSSEMSFKLAAKGAFRDAMSNAAPVLLEPVVSLVVYVEDQYLGDVLSDLSSRRGKVSGQESIGGGIQVIRAQVPQAELLRYSIDLKSITSGTASFEMEFSHYNPITGKIAEDVISASKRDEG